MFFAKCRIVITDIGHIAYDLLDSYPVSFALFQQIWQLLAIGPASVCYLNPGDDSVITHRNMCFAPEKCGCRRLMAESCIFIIFRANLPNAVAVQQFLYTIVQCLDLGIVTRFHSTLYFFKQFVGICYFFRQVRLYGRLLRESLGQVIFPLIYLLAERSG